MSLFRWPTSSSLLDFWGKERNLYVCVRGTSQKGNSFSAVKKPSRFSKLTEEDDDKRCFLGLVRSKQISTKPSVGSTVQETRIKLHIITKSSPGLENIRGGCQVERCKVLLYTGTTKPLGWSTSELKRGLHKLQNGRISPLQIVWFSYVKIPRTGVPPARGYGTGSFSLGE